MNEEIEQAIKLLQKNGYIVKKWTPAMEEDSKECEDMAEAGRSFFTCGLRGRTEMDKRLFGDWRSESGPGQFL